MSVRFRTVCALIASLAVLGGTLATYAAPASAESPDCQAACSFHFGQPPNTQTGASELGLQFQADIDGWIAGICFWEAPTESGPHTVTLWGPDGTSLGTATGTGTPGIENCVDLNPLVQVTPGVTYTASYAATTASYVDLGQFKARFDLNHLHALIGAGVKGDAGAAPATVDGNSGYGVDIAFVSTLAGVINDCVSTLTAPTNVTSGVGDHRAAVSWWPATSDPEGCIAGYVVTPFIDDVAQTPVVIPGPGTTTVIGGLTDGVTYTFTVAAESGRTIGPASDASAPLTIGTPDAPTEPSAAHAGHHAIRVAFGASGGNGAPVAKYTATCKSPGGGVTRSNSGASSPIKVTRLTKGKKYNCSVRATNSRGTGRSSQTVKARA